MIAAARKLDLLTTPYVFSEADAVAMAKAGADIIVCHMGLTTGGTIGAETALTLDGCVPLIDAWSRAALDVNPQAIVLCHGGPIAMPADAQYILAQCPQIHGFYGASLDGAAADRGRDDRADAQVHGDGEMSTARAGSGLAFCPPGRSKPSTRFQRGQKARPDPYTDTEPLSPAQR